jgi:hypothetical protein
MNLTSAADYPILKIMVSFPTATKPPSMDDLLAAVRAACQNRPIARMELFGSVARGAFGPASDVDLLVDFLPEANVGLFEMGDLKEELEQRLGCPVDLVSRRAVENSRNSIRRRAILSNPVTLYAR